MEIGRKDGPNSCYSKRGMSGQVEQGSTQPPEDSLLGPSILARRVWAKLLLVVLLLGVAGLATAAKDSLYHFHSTTAQHVCSSTKMQTVHPSAVELEPALPVLAILPASPKYRRSLVKTLSVSFVPSVGVVVSLQHRSPPYLFS